MEGSSSENHVPILSVRGLSKSFGGARALDDVSLTVLPGSPRPPRGNNSRKSTLIKILAGYHQPDDGELEVRGEPVKLRSIRGSSGGSA